MGRATGSIVKYEAAFRAFEARDYASAVRLLEPAVHASAYASDILNHTYTLALYHSGERARLAASAFQIGQGLLAHDPASALDYFQRALYAGLDPARSRQIGEIFEGWAVVPSAVTRGEALHGRLPSVAHVVGSLLPGRVSFYVRDLCRSLGEAVCGRGCLQPRIFPPGFLVPAPLVDLKCRSSAQRFRRAVLKGISLSAQNGLLERSQKPVLTSPCTMLIWASRSRLKLLRSDRLPCRLTSIMTSRWTQTFSMVPYICSEMRSRKHSFQDV